MSGILNILSLSGFTALTWKEVRNANNWTCANIYCYF